MWAHLKRDLDLKQNPCIKIIRSKSIEIHVRDDKKVSSYALTISTYIHDLLARLINILYIENNSRATVKKGGKNVIKKIIMK